MSASSQSLRTFHALYESPVVSVFDYCCRECRCGPAAEERSDANSIVLMRRGTFSLHFGRRTVAADVNQVVFFSKGSTYRVSHPADGGDRGTTLSAPPHILRDILRDLEPTIDERPDRPFSFTSTPCSTAMMWRHRELVLRLEAVRTDPPEALWVETTALELLAALLEGAHATHAPKTERRRDETLLDHRERVEVAKSYLAAHMVEHVTLNDVARASHASPFHLARTFRKHTGEPIHQYLTHLRLRTSLERLAVGTEDLTSIALDLGFSSHSHFTDTFRRAFGRPPSAVRSGASRRTIREMSKNLEVRDSPSPLP